MNAPAESGLAVNFIHVPTTSLAPSGTIAQARRRARFDPERLQQLTASVQQVGIMQPILVRAHPATTVHRRFEIVAGERRWLAAQAAGLALVPVIVTNAGDGELVELQLIENKQREDVHPLDEADGYRELMDVQKISADEVATRIGLSRSHVYNRLKLLQVAPEVTAALEAGQIHHSAALRLARIPGPKLQKKALKIALEKNWRGEPLSDRELADRLQKSFMVRLDGVPFDLGDATLKPGACTDCPHYSGNDLELQAELAAAHGADARVCTNTPCHDAKVQEHFHRRREAALGAGKRVIEGDEARALRPTKWNPVIDGFVDLDAECEEIQPTDAQAEDPNWRPPTYRSLLGDASLDTVLFIDPHNRQPRDLLSIADARKRLKEQGIKLPTPRKTEAAAPTDAVAEREARDKQRAREQLEQAFRAELARRCYAKWKGPVKRDDWLAIAQELAAGAGDMEETLLGQEADLEKLSERELMALCALLLLGRTLWTANSPAPLLALAKRLRIDPAKVRKDVKAAAKDQPEENT